MTVYYYLHEPVALIYSVTVNPPPADSSKAVFHKNSDTGAAFFTDSSLRTSGTNLTLNFTPKGKCTVQDSPVSVEFVFTKKGATVPEIKCWARFVLAEPAVGEVKVPADGKPGSPVQLEVAGWTALHYDSPGVAAEHSPEDPGRVPPEAKSAVSWKADGKDVPGKGDKAQLTLEESQVGKTVEVEGFLEKKTKAGAKALIKVPKLKIVDPSAGDAPKAVAVGGEVALALEVTPEVGGEVTWSAAGDQVEVTGDGKSATVKGKKGSAAKDDVTVKAQLKSAKTQTVYEVEHKLTVDEVEITKPVDGKVYLTGWRLPLEGKWKHGTQTPEDIEWVIQHGEGSRDSVGPWKVKDAPPTTIELKREGAYKISVKAGAPPDKVVKVEAVTPEVLEIEYLDGKDFQDKKPPPHFKRDAGDAKPTVLEPAWYLRNKKPKLKVKVKAAKDLSEPAQVEVAGLGSYDPNECEEPLGQGEHRFAPLDAKAAAPASLQALAAGQQLTLELSKPLTRCGAYDGTWNLTYKAKDAKAARPFGGDDPRFRLLVTWAEPKFQVNYRGYRSTAAMLTRAHVDAVARWAGMREKNDKEGVCHAVDNNVRHWVPWPQQEEFAKDKRIMVPDYAPGTAPPKNHTILEGEIDNGRRGVSSLLYPMEDKDNTKEFNDLVRDFGRYTGNAGWRMLDNPDYVSGRCDQQAALMVDLFGTHGIEASLLKLERIGITKSGRPCLRFFNCYEGGTGWNFHGIAKAKMEDGNYCCYDGSFSSPPNRKHDTQKVCEGERGPFIHSWLAGWRYKDAKADADRRKFGSTNDEVKASIERIDREAATAKSRLAEVTSRVKEIDGELPTADGDAKRTLEAERKELIREHTTLRARLVSLRDDRYKATKTVPPDDLPTRYDPSREESSLSRGAWTGIPE